VFDIVLRALKDRLFAPIARHCGWLSPTLVTILAFAVGLASAWTAARAAYAAALICWVANRALDGFDGTLARVTNRQTDFGGYLDILLDFVVYAIIPVALVAGLGWPTDAARAALLLEASFFVNAASWMYPAAILERRARGAAATGEQTTVTMPPGLIAGTETGIIYSLFFLLPTRLPLLFLGMATLVTLTIVQRLIWAMRRL